MIVEEQGSDFWTRVQLPSSPFLKGQAHMNFMDMRGSELLEKLNNEEVSFLYEIGAGDLKEEMMPAGRLCRLLAEQICKTKDDSKLRKKAISILKTMMPASLKAPFPEVDEAVVAGFNHPSLGEIFRLLYLGFEAYPEKDFLFPVNIPWYENMIPIIPKLKRLGIYITPMITPSTENKLQKRFADDDGKLAEMQYVKLVFVRHYMTLLKNFVQSHDVIMVAPSATRQAQVLSEKINPTMTFIANVVCRKENAEVVFLPVTVIEPRDYNRSVNIFRTYGIHPCEPFSAAEVRELTSKTKDFDYRFLERIEGIHKEATAHR